MTTGPAIGLFVDLRNPAQWHVEPGHLVGQTLEIVAHAEQLGAASVWATEHHLFDDGYLGQPLTLAAALAARTTTMRIGTAILVAPFRHPRHIAEQAALVDAISGGRLELGLGSGYVDAEFAAFDADPARRLTATDEVFARVRRLLDGESLGPAPVQHPLPMWLGYQGPRNAARAGRLGAGLLTLNRSSLDPYLEALERAGYPAGTARMGGAIDVIVSRDPERAWQRIRPHYAHQALTYLRAHDPAATLPHGSLDSRLGATRRGVDSVRLSVLTPEETVAEITRRTDCLPVSHVYLWASVANMPRDVVEEHVELLFGEVAPRVGARDVDTRKA